MQRWGDSKAIARKKKVLRDPTCLAIISDCVHYHILLFLQGHCHGYIATKFGSGPGGGGGGGGGGGALRL